MPLTSTLFRIIVHFLVSLVWFDGVAAGKGSSPTEGKPAKPWHRGGQFFKRMIKNPTPTTIFGLVVLLVVLRLLIGLLPLLLFLLATLIFR